jgi:hypothetical protein
MAALKRYIQHLVYIRRKNKTHKVFSVQKLVYFSPEFFNIQRMVVQLLPGP